MVAAESHEVYDVHRAIGELEGEMLEAADALEFERAALLRDEIRELKRMLEAETGGAVPAKVSKRKGKKAAYT